MKRAAAAAVARRAGARLAGASPWVPVIAAAVIGALGYALLVRPASARVARLDAELRLENARLEQAEGRLRAVLRIPRVSLPLSPAELQARWPAALAAAAAHGETVELMSFTPTTVQAGAAPRASAVEVTVRLRGPYLGLDGALSGIASLFPLWSWKTLEISGSGTGDVQATATAVVALSAPASPRGSALPPPPPRGGLPGPGESR